MNINQRRFNQLTEMGISLWQHKESAFEDSSTNKSDVLKQDNFIQQTSLSLNELAKQRVFLDIIQSLGLSIGEVNYKKDHLDLGLFNWYFTSQTPNNNVIHCTDNNLITPSISIISQLPDLKKQLWKTIMNTLL
jgi:hypothetical protein